MNMGRQLSVATTIALAATLALGGCKKDADDAATTADTSSLTRGGTVGADSATRALEVADVTLGRHIGADRRVTDQAETFAPNDTIYASVRTTGTQGGRVTARWSFENGQQVDERSETVAAAATGDTYTEFHISKPGGWPTGKYTLRILVNDREVQSKDFTIAAK
jgi:hypothetical protein